MGRYRSLNGDANEANDSEGSLNSWELGIISGMHQLRHFVDAGISVAQGTRTVSYISSAVSFKKEA
jgi:hypothetical protein